MPRYHVETGGPTWNQIEDEELLDAVLSANSEAAFNGACDRHTDARGRGHQRVIKGQGPARRRLWGLAVGMAQYTPTDNPRQERTGPLTWVEIWVIGIAAQSEVSERLFRPDEQYIARLLNRPIEMVRRRWEQADPRKKMKGLGL